MLAPAGRTSGGEEGAALAGVEGLPGEWGGREKAGAELGDGEIGAEIGNMRTGSMRKIDGSGNEEDEGKREMGGGGGK